jgi:hypothetical protein
VDPLEAGRSVVCGRRRSASLLHELSTAASLNYVPSAFFWSESFHCHPAQIETASALSPSRFNSSSLPKKRTSSNPFHLSSPSDSRITASPTLATAPTPINDMYAPNILLIMALSRNVNARYRLNRTTEPRIGKRYASEACEDVSELQ